MDNCYTQYAEAQTLRGTVPWNTAGIYAPRSMNPGQGFEEVDALWRVHSYIVARSSNLTTIIGNGDILPD